LASLLEPPHGRQVFAASFAPASADIDENGHVNNVVYLRWAQELAFAHWRAKAPVDEQDRWAWIVLRHEVDYRRALLPGETATARTWVDPHADGPRFGRTVRIDGRDGAMCAQAYTTWCLVDAASGRPRRVPAWMVETFA
jgi:acyl-CoA thioester hydrolase